MRIELGCKVKDVVTGYTGIVTAQCIYLNGCVQYQVENAKKKGEEIQERWIDAQRLKVVSGGKVIIEKLISEKKSVKNALNPDPAKNLKLTGGGHRSHPSR